ncbi:VCBS repeat-containing protein [Actinoplanes sp. NPDC051861]|uniref:FG-GAP repeat domain-containing protein n=1 Tax=Actinoplanes sp. NPDC051861 TaxID=3155170 RepID=UPI003449454C
MALRRGTTACVMAVLTAVLLCVQAPAASAAPAASTRCLPGGVSTADQLIAEGLRPSMTGRRLGRLISGRHIACARAIVDQVLRRGLDQRAAVLAVTTAIAESTLNNHSVATDHDSLGLFQQRPSQGWGRPDQLVDPRYATDAFLNAMLRKHPRGAWLTGDIGAICQRVQNSAFPGAYAPEALDAQLIVATLLRSAPVPAGRRSGSSRATARPAAPAGPFQRILAAVGAELGPLTGRHDLALADWNRDGRPDLVVVTGTGTVTGKTEIRIMDGVSNFAAMLLTTATALGPTDDRHAYSVADWNGDGWLDLIVAQAGRVTVVDGASRFQRVLLDTATAPIATAGRMADWNGDGRLDLVSVQTARTSSRKVEVRVLDGASLFQQPLGSLLTTAEPAADDVEFRLADWNADRRPDLVILGRSGGRTTIRVLDAASQLRRYLVKATTAYDAADERHTLMIDDADGDRRPDLVAVQKFGTPTGRPEVTTFAG